MNQQYKAPAWVCEALGYSLAPDTVTWPEPEAPFLLQHGTKEMEICFLCSLEMPVRAQYS